MNASSFDIITVGGGLAASTFAKSMSERGVKVLVLEREERFKDRVRGEFIVTWGVAEAKELGILDLLRQSCAIEVPWIDLGFGPRDLRTTTPQQLPGLSFSHPEMQETLLSAAENAGVETMSAGEREVRCNGLRRRHSDYGAGAVGVGHRTRPVHKRIADVGGGGDGGCRSS